MGESIGSAFRPSQTINPDNFDIATEAEKARFARYAARRKRLEESGESVPVTDSIGRAYSLPDSLRVMDCAQCKRIMVSSLSMVPAADWHQLEVLGGYRGNGYGHIRPYCKKCHIQS